MKSNFSFLPWLDLSLLGQSAEANVETDPIVSIIKCRQFVELATNKMLSFENLVAPIPNTLASRIELLKIKKRIPDVVYQSLSAIRRKGNEAVHDLVGSVQEAYTAIQDCYKIAVWMNDEHGYYETPEPFHLSVNLETDTTDLSVSLRDLSQLKKVEKQAIALFRTFSYGVGQSFGFFNTHGEICIDPIFKNVRVDEGKVFYNDLAAAADENGQWGFIDKEGRFVITPSYIHVNHFSEGFAVVRKRERYEFIDLQGERINRSKYHGAYSFSDGMAAVQDKSGLWGFINHEGRNVIKPTYTDMAYFRNGVAAVTETPRNNYGYKKNKLIDKNGTIVLDESYDYDIIGASEGYALVQKDQYYGGGYQFIHLETGEQLLSADVEEAELFYEGFAAVKIKGRWTFINHKGELIADPRFSFVSSFSEDGYAEVMSGNKNGIIHSSGRMIVPVVYDEVYRPSDGLIGVRKDWKYSHNYMFDKSLGYLDLNGKEVISTRFSDGNEFSFGVAAVREQGKWIFIDKAGEKITTANCDGEMKEIWKFE